MTQRLVTLMLALLTLGSAGYGADTDPFPDVNPYAYYGSMMMAVKVTAYSEVLSRDIVVAVYSGDEIRGKSRPRDASNPGVAYITVYGSKTGEPLTFKVYVKGIVAETEPLLTYTFNGMVGSVQTPYLLNIGPYLQHTGITVQSSSDKYTVCLDGDSEHTVSIPVPLMFDSIAYNRTFVPEQYASVCLPFDITEEMTFAGGEFYRFADISHQDGKWCATMMRVSTVEANRPYLFVADDTQLTIASNGHKHTLLTEAWEPEPKNEWTFRGTYEKLQWASAANDYDFTENGGDDNLQRDFLRLAQGDYILPLRSYLSYVGDTLTTPIQLPDTVEIRLVDEDGQPVGIGSIYEVNNEGVKSKTSTGTVYDLAGRKTLIPRQGITGGLYIVNGQKFIVK